MIGWIVSIIFLIIGAINGGDLNDALVAGLFAIAGSIGHGFTGLEYEIRKFKTKETKE